MFCALGITRVITHLRSAYVQIYKQSNIHRHIAHHITYFRYYVDNGISSILVKRRKDTARSIYDPLYISIRNPTRPIGNVLSAGFIYFNTIFSGSSSVGWDDIAEEWFKLECEKILSLWNQLGYIWHWCDFGGYHGDHLKGKLTFYGNFHAISSKCVRTQLWGNVILMFKVLMKALCLNCCIHIVGDLHLQTTFSKLYLVSFCNFGHRYDCFAKKKCEKSKHFFTMKLRFQLKRL